MKEKAWTYIHHAAIQTAVQKAREAILKWD